MLVKAVLRAPSKVRRSDLRCIRNFTSLLNQDPNSITVEKLKSASVPHDDEANPAVRLALIKAINSSSNNEKKVLLDHLIPSFSLYFRLKSEQNVLNTNEIIARFLRLNPGRVHQTWDLFKTHEPQLSNELSAEVATIVIEKLINGEVYELSGLEEGEKFQISQSNLPKILYLVDNYLSQPESKDVLVLLIDRLLEDGYVDFVSWLVGKNIFPNQFLASYLGQNKATSLGYLTVFSHLLNSEPQLIQPEQLVRALKEVYANKNLSQELEAKRSLPEYPAATLDIESLGKTIISYIETSKLDLEKHPQSLLMRLQLIETYGIDMGDLETAMKLFHHYQSHAKVGLDLVQNSMFKCYSYQAVAQNKEIFLKIAQTILPAEDLSIKVLQTMIVSSSNFDIEASLGIYNDYIQQVSRKVNEVTKRSSSGLLTESLILSSLYNNDRNFSTLILEKATENGLLTNEYEIAQIKQLFKAYGASFVEDDDWEKAKVIFKNYVLQYLRKL